MVEVEAEDSRASADVMTVVLLAVDLAEVGVVVENRTHAWASEKVCCVCMDLGVLARQREWSLAVDSVHSYALCSRLVGIRSSSPVPKFLVVLLVLWLSAGCRCTACLRPSCYSQNAPTELSLSTGDSVEFVMIVVDDEGYDL